MSEVTRILAALGQDQPRAADDLLPLVYEELRRLAARRLSRESADQTLQPTALVHEAYLRLIGSESPSGWNGQGHFFGAAAEAMRRILVERARRKQAEKHGGGRQRVAIDGIDVATEARPEELLALDEALEKLAAEDPQKAELVKLRYFGGLSIEESAEAMGISTATAKRWWVFARTWLMRELGSEGQDAAD
jgi:RNA polymerase sigma factor (TIGR02999 family)